MEVLVSERIADVIPEAKVKETDSLITNGKAADILDAPINTVKGWAGSEELSLLHITWD